MTVKTDITDPLISINQRLTRLEAVDAIKTLKATYLMACDTKDPALMRDCFIDGELVIDYGPVGQFNHREQLVEIFTDIGCHPHMLESHHGHNPIIELIDDHYANNTVAKNFLNELLAAMKGPKYFNNDDAQSDYFHRSHYTDINVGKWNTPYELVA